MKKRIYLSISLLASIAVVCSSLLLVTIFYNFYITNQKRSLKDYVNIVANTLEMLEFDEMENIAEIVHPDYRITIMDNRGEVMFDSSTDSDILENHINREEIRESLEKGFGESFRYSATIGKDTYYYAILLSNKFILRASRQMDNIISVFMRIIPGTLLILFSILVVSFFITPILTAKILKPVEETASNIEKIINGEESQEISTYEELVPFIKATTIQSQEIDSYIKDLKEKAETMEVITSSMKEGLILVDEDGNIISTNPSGIKILGGDEKSSYSGNNFIRLCRNIEINEALHDAINTMESRDITVKIHDKYLRFFVSPIISEESVFSAVILVMDYTEKHELEMIRRDFSANVSHELKTPLTTINGYAEMIETGMVKEEDIRRFSGIIREEGIRLLDIIDSIMRLSKIEEKQEKEYFPLDVYSIADDIVGRLSVAAADKNIELNLSGKKAIINGNQTMIEEMLFNLVDNGIKYTKPLGKVNLDIRDDEGYCYITVYDTGIGIPKEAQDRVFERFYTVDKSRSKKTQSTGLGLSIVKHIVEYHRGIIYLNSEENKGTEIVVTLPNNL